MPALGGEVSTHFHPWAEKIAQEALEGAQGDLQGTKNHNLGRKLVSQIVKNDWNWCPNLDMEMQVEK